MLDDDEYIRSSVLDSVSDTSGLVVLQLIIRNDGLYDVYRAVRGRLPSIVEEALQVDEARDFWSQALQELFSRVCDEQDDTAMLVAGRLKGIFPPGAAVPEE